MPEATPESKITASERKAALATPARSLPLLLSLEPAITMDGRAFLNLKASSIFGKCWVTFFEFLILQSLLNFPPGKIKSNKSYSLGGWGFGGLLGLLGLSIGF